MDFRHDGNEILLPFWAGLHRNDDLASTSAGERLAGPQTIPSASPLHHPTTQGIVENVVSKRSSLFGALFLHGYCDVVSWDRGLVEKFWAMEIHSQARLGRVTTWMGDLSITYSNSYFF